MASKEGETEECSKILIEYYLEPAYVFLAATAGIDAKHASIVFIDPSNKEYVLKCEMTLHQKRAIDHFKTAFGGVNLVWDIAKRASKMGFFDIPITTTLQRVAWQDYQKNISKNNEFQIYASGSFDKIKTHMRTKDNSEFVKVDATLLNVERSWYVDAALKWSYLPYNLVYRNCQHLACHVFKKFTNTDLELPNKKELDMLKKNPIIGTLALTNKDFKMEDPIFFADDEDTKRMKQKRDVLQYYKA